MTKEEILNYVMNTPENTNRMVLNDMINELVNSSGGGASVFTVTFTPTNEEQTAFTADKTISEIEAAYEEGAIIQGRFGQQNDMYTILNLNSIGSGLATFERVTIYDNSLPILAYMTFVVYSGGVNSFASDFELTPVPDIPDEPDAPEVN